MEKVTEEFLEKVILENTETLEVRDSRTGAIVKKEIVNVKVIVRSVMAALRNKKSKAKKVKTNGNKKTKRNNKK